MCSDHRLQEHSSLRIVFSIFEAAVLLRVP